MTRTGVFASRWRDDRAWRKAVQLRSSMRPDQAVTALARVTSAAGMAQFLHGNAGETREPLLRGHVGWGNLAVADFTESIGRGSFIAWLIGTLEPAHDGGVVVRAIVGARRSMLVMMWIVRIVFISISAALIGSGISDLTGHRDSSAVLFFIVPIVLLAFGLVIERTGRRDLAQSRARLIKTIRTVIDAEISANLSGDA